VLTTRVLGRAFADTLGSQDAVALCFCEGCALCQELNEVDLRTIYAAQAQRGGQPGFVVNTVTAVQPLGGQGVTYIVPPEAPKM
jgi:hypothetical protein